MPYIFDQSACRVRMNDEVLAGYFTFADANKGSQTTGFIGKTEAGEIRKISFSKVAVSDDELIAKVKALDFSSVPKLKRKK